LKTETVDNRSLPSLAVLPSIARRVSSSRAGGSKSALSRYFVDVSAKCIFLNIAPFLAFGQQPLSAEAV